jgi:hypothetical protein
MVSVTFSPEDAAVSSVPAVLSVLLAPVLEVPVLPQATNDKTIAGTNNADNIFLYSILASLFYFEMNYDVVFIRTVPD